VDANIECERLRSEMANMARALDKKDDFINQLEHRIQDM
jgi:hypothetical protein